jgi:3-dehydroquinate synthase
MISSKVAYFKSINELEAYCEQKIKDESHLVFIDNNVLFKFPTLGNSSMETIAIKVSEEEKNIDTVSEIWKIMFEKSIQRSSTIFSIGGGVVSDAVGFAASTYKRGTKLITIPTTLLSMVDAAHGGKNGINNEFGKNQIGTFMMPQEVLICPEFLSQLPEKEIKTGLIELIKAGFLGSPELVEKVYEVDVNNIDVSLISEAIDIKNNIVTNDFKESSERMFLNFGHTIGHLIEADSHHKISHGEAVAVGMLKAMQISEKLSGLAHNVSEKFEQFLDNLQISTNYEFKKNSSQLKELLSNDKKVENSKVKYVLLKNIGEPVLIDYYIRELLDEVINE